jgi:acetyl esterase/lipase
VFVHGGGWKNGSKESVKKRLWLVPNGFAIASINYRLTNVGKWPDQINDCYAAVRWLRKNAERYNLAADKIGCWGTSAGGHLAALMRTMSAMAGPKPTLQIRMERNYWEQPSVKFRNWQGMPVQLTTSAPMTRRF